MGRKRTLAVKRRRAVRDMAARYRSWADENSGGSLSIRLFHPLTPLRSEGGEAVCDCILQFDIVGIQIPLLAGDGVVVRRQPEQELFRRRVYGAHGLYAALSRPLSGIFQRASVRVFGHDTSVIM